MSWKILQHVRFEEPQESEFRAYFEEQSQKSRAELWIILLVSMAVVIAFHGAFLQLPPDVVPLGKMILAGVIVPAILRGLSVRGRPFHHLATELYIVAAYIDIVCLLVLRVACIRAGYDVVPLIIPVAILLSLIVVQIPFVLLVPVVLVGLTGIVGVELLAFDLSSNGLFQLAAAMALVIVALTPAYDIERWTRIGWQRQRRLNELAELDELTGLATRRSFEERFRETLRAGLRSGKSVTLMILDVDHFKVYNDHFGHPAGDHCLNVIGNYLRVAMRRPQDFAARIGGEEFAVVWFDLKADDVPRVADGLIRGIADLGLVPPPEGGSSVTASGGVVHAREIPHEGPVDQILAPMMKFADDALYRAKAQGRNRVVVSERGTDAILTRPLPSDDAFDGDGEATTREQGGRGLREVFAQLRQGLQFREPWESDFRAAFDAQGRSSRRLILTGLLLVIGIILVIAIPVLKVPKDQYFIGAATLVVGLAPATILALLGTLIRSLFRWSAVLYVGAVAVILTAQMWERVIQLPKGHDMVPFIMPISVLLSLSVVQIRYGLMAPALAAGLIGVVGVELWAFELTSHRLLDVATAALMVLVTLSFSYKLERSTRVGWKYQHYLHELAHTDALTGLPNRRKFDAAFERVLRTAAREQRSVSLLLLDIDHFKSFNDHFGHPAGDQCLKQIGAHLSRSMRRPLDFAARIGGEEFAAVWFDAQPDNAHRMAEQLRAGIEALAITAAPAHGPLVTASGGLVHVESPSLATRSADISARLISNADAALYEAKSGGRNQLSVSRGTDPLGPHGEREVSET